jgi:hypothetical protein
LFNGVKYWLHHPNLVLTEKKSMAKEFPLLSNKTAPLQSECSSIEDLFLVDTNTPEKGLILRENDNLRRYENDIAKTVIATLLTPMQHRIIYGLLGAKSREITRRVEALAKQFDITPADVLQHMTWGLDMLRDNYVAARRIVERETLTLASLPSASRWIN